MVRSRPLALERLEDRLTPSTSGVTWPDGSHLTLSFVPDGTLVGDSSSNLFAALNASGSTAAWQREILRAFQAWAAPANVNVGVVADGGQAMGTTALVQGDARFGDIRIAAVPLDSTTLITNTQFQWSGTSWSGDIVINSSYRFSIGGAAGTIDLYTAMLNEAGNVLGVLDTATDPTSGVYYQYTGPKGGITAGDVADIRSLYGQRTVDPYDAAGANESRNSATNLGIPLTGLFLQGDVMTATDVDCYRFTLPVLTPGVLGLNVRLTTSGLSSFVGTMQVYNAFGQLVGTATATDPLQGDLNVLIGGGGLVGQLLGGLSYCVRVAGNSAAFGVGSYQLTVSYNLYGGGVLGPVLGPVGGLLDPELFLNDTLATALTLPSNLINGQKPDARFDYTLKASISSGQDVDYFRVKAPTAVGQKMNVLVWALEPNRLLPKVEVFDAAGNLLPSTLLANENGTFSVEVTNVASGGAYTIKVSALHPGGSHDSGNYFMGVDYTTQPPTALTTFASGRLSADDPQDWSSLTVAENRLYEFVLSAAAIGQAQVRMDIYDAAGSIVFTLRSYAGKPASTGHVYLKAGKYRVQYSAAAPPGSALPAVDYSLTGRIVSDPIGPRRDKGDDAAAPGHGPDDVSNQPSSSTNWDQPYYA